MANEKRLIDAYEFYRKFIDLHTIPVGEQRYVATWRISDLIADAPTVNAVEVVRCKDCKHYDNSEGICWCKLNSKFFPGGFDWHGFPEDGFCSYGERRTDDG